MCPLVVRLQTATNWTTYFIHMLSYSRERRAGTWTLRKRTCSLFQRWDKIFLNSRWLYMNQKHHLEYCLQWELVPWVLLFQYWWGQYTSYSITVATVQIQQVHQWRKKCQQQVQKLRLVLWLKKGREFMCGSISHFSSRRPQRGYWHVQATV